MPCICFLHSFYPHHDKFSLSAHTVSHVAAGIQCELQGQELQSVPDWICWRKESFGIAPEISPSHSLPLSFSTQNNIQHSSIPNIKNVRSLGDVFLFSISCLVLEFWEHWFLHVQTQRIELIKLICVHAQTQFKQFRCDGQL